MDEETQKNLKLPNDEVKNIEKGERSIWSFFIKNFRITYLLLIGLVLFGVLAVFSIPKESAPEVDIPVVIVTTALPGASATDVEELVTDQLEPSVQGMDGLDTVTSVSSQGFSQITVNFNADEDGREKLTDVKDNIDSASADLPDDANDPFVQRVSFSDVPILRLAVSGPYETPQLKTYAEDLQDDMEQISDVSDVNISGAPERVIEVVMNQEKLSQYDLSVNQVANGISQSNSAVPIGSIQTANTNYTVRFDGRLGDAEDVRKSAIAQFGGAPVFVSDIATVNDTFNDSSTITRQGGFGEDPQTSVSLALYKISGQGDILSISDETERIIRDAKATYLPDNVEVAITQNDADTIRNDLSTLTSSGILTVIILLAVLIFFLGWRAAILASLVAPLTFMITLMLLGPLGYTINFLTLFSLILALGILVDAAIVVTESVFEKMEEGMDVKDAVYGTIGEFQQPLIAGTLTTVFVFAPMLLMSGIIGKFIQSIPVTITIVLLSAIFVALGILTTLATRFLNRKNTVQKNENNSGNNKYVDAIFLWYERKIADVLRSRWTQNALLGVLSVLFVVAVSLPVVGIVKVNMFPSGDAGTITVEVENPIGTPLSETNGQLRQLETIISEDAFVESYIATAGQGGNAGSVSTGGTNSHIGNISVNLSDDDRPTSSEIVAMYEDELTGIINGEVTVSEPAAGPGQGSPVQAKLVGSDLDDLDTAARKVASVLEGIDGTRNVDNGIEEGAGEFVVTVDRPKAQSFGVSPAQIAGVLRSSVSGSNATIIRQDGNDIDVNLKFQLTPEDETIGSVSKISVSQMESIPVLTPQGNVPLSTFASFSLAGSRSSINHEDGDRTVTVSSGVMEGTTAADVTMLLQERLSDDGLPESVTLSFGGESEDIAESFGSLGQAMVIGILLIFGLLIWQFKSFRQPLFVLATIPLALIGVLPGLALIGAPFSFPGFIGIVALAGIVVNNAIILIDSINNNRAIGFSVNESVEKSANARLQPILLTTLSTVLAMIPLGLSDPTWAPLAYSIIFGLSFSAVSTLFVVPVLYVKFMQKNYLKDE